MSKNKQENEDNGINLDIGYQTIAGIKPENEDAAGFFVPADLQVIYNKGIVAVVSDGVSSAEAGKEASATAVANFIEDYYQTPDTWSVSHAGQKILTAINLKLFRKSHEFTNEEKGYLCTFSGVIIKSQMAHVFHAGDSRIYRLKNGLFEQLTRDHIAPLGQGRNILARAVGMDNSLHIDYIKLPVEAKDIFMLSSDGLHDFVGEADICKILSTSVSAEQKSNQLVELAEQNNSDDNISCVVVDIINLPSENLDDFSHKLTRLPFPPALSVGMKIDGFTILNEIFASNRSQLYLVEDQSGYRMVMKTPSINFEDDLSYIDRFVQEEWIGKRISSPNIVKTITQKTKRQFLYYLMEYIEGETLESWMVKNRFPKPAMAIKIIEKIAQGLQAFHDQETIHQDLKPGNIMITADENVKIVDFGSVYVAGVAEIFRPIEHTAALGTATYSDPHYLLGKNSGIQGDLYSLATITYELFTGELPFGNKITECRSYFEYDRLRYRSANQFNPMVPVWFDRAIEYAVVLDLEKRYSSIDKFLIDLHNPNPNYLLDDPKMTKNKNQLLFWQIISGFWLISFVLVMMLFSS